MNRPNAALKVAGIALALSALGGALTGCGGSDGDGAADAPKAATKDGFCAKMTDITTTLSQRDPKDSEATVEAIHDWVGDVEDYGTPSELSDEGRDGFEVLLSVLKGVKDDAKPQDLQNLLGGLPAADVKKMQAFSVWTTNNCVQSSGAS